ncbi:DUF485 domain-containing protein [Streptomyces sp. GESEQ-35]|uniref:DUF485 domain-containing protein n=1 Tax=Streptomyces sp. GESEQ-35 TaxID=2812657 RepID=UPI001B33B2FB|nr:DUF485 domain-containing protein [Streptomyces sp. GESEQ-35]
MPEDFAWRDDAPAFHSPNTARTPSQSISDHPDFHSLRRNQRRFGTKATVLSVGGFLLYVLLSSFAPAVMNQPLFGHLTLGLALGLGQFAVMAFTAWRYTRHMSTRVDPLARGLRAQLSQQEERRNRTADRTTDRHPRGYRTW